MNPKERVLGPAGFEPFPERLKEKAIAQGNLAPEPDKGDPTASDLPEHGKKGKAEMASFHKEVAKAQKIIEARAKEKKHHHKK